MKLVGGPRIQLSSLSVANHELGSRRVRTRLVVFVPPKKRNAGGEAAMPPKKRACNGGGEDSESPIRPEPLPQSVPAVAVKSEKRVYTKTSPVEPQPQVRKRRRITAETETEAPAPLDMVKIEAKSEASSSRVGSDVLALVANTCLGCGRDSKTGKCFIKNDEIVGWVGDRERQRMCRDCSNLFRTCYKGEHLLSLFGTCL